MSLERHTVVVDGGALALVLHLPERVPCVVACHGLVASRDGDTF